MSALTCLECVLLVTALLIGIEAAPNCSFQGAKNNEVVCIPTNDTNYILKRGLISDSNRTTSVTLKGCRISDIDKQSFNNLFFLKSIDLSGNIITNLKLGVLDGTSKVTYLNLSMNLISELSLGVFDKNPDLLTLDLSSNQLRDLKVGTFDALKKLKYLDLSNNSLDGQDLNPYILDRNTLLKHIDFSKNHMNEAPENLLVTMETIILNECFLTEIPVFITRRNLETLKILFLAKNQINTLQNVTFVNLENLEKLDLSENILESIKDKDFVPLRKLKIIILRKNRLVSLSDKAFQNMQFLGNIDLSYNKLMTVPVNAFRGTALKNLNVSNNRFTYLIDNFCLELRNSGVRLTKFYFNQNPWQCSCLRETLSEVKKFEIEYNSAYYNGEHPVCTTTDEFRCQRQPEFNDVYIKMYDNLNRKN